MFFIQALFIILYYFVHYMSIMHFGLHAKISPDTSDQSIQGRPLGTVDTVLGAYKKQTGHKRAKAKKVVYLYKMYYCRSERFSASRNNEFIIIVIVD